MAELLRLEAVTSGYGESVVVEEASLAIGEGEAVALLGRNGVGKTTLLTTVMGLTHLHRGAIRWRGGDRGSRRTRGARRVGWCAGALHVESLRSRHLAVAAEPGRWRKVPGYFRAWPSAPIIAARSFRTAAADARDSARARRNPRLLLLDEPMEGLAPIVVRAHQCCSAGACRDDGDRLVEQHAELALALTQRAVVWSAGASCTGPRARYPRGPCAWTGGWRYPSEAQCGDARRELRESEERDE